jgi:3-phosphoshikimate 1-carboxyvinyltransferase
MGGRITIENERTVGGEPIADLVAESSELQATNIGGDEIPTLIDEIPALVVAALAARGDTTIRDAAELRVKETDRIAAVVTEFGHLRAEIEPRDDGMVVHGGARLWGAPVDPRGDHRLAMALAIGGLLADGETTIADPACVEVSYPTFWQDLERLGASR